MENLERLEITQRNLEQANEDYKKYSRDFAVNEAEYRRGLSIKIIELRAGGMAATLVLDISKGDERISEAKMKRDIAEGLLNAANHAVINYRLELKILMEFHKIDVAYQS